MSKAFDRAMDEIARVWDAGDRADTKIMQWVSISAAGFFATLAILAPNLRAVLRLPRSETILTLFAIGTVFVLLSFLASLHSVTSPRYAGPIDPGLLGKHPHYLYNDPAFERDALPAVAMAFRLSVRAQELKWRWFRVGLVLQALGIVLLLSAVPVYIGGVRSVNQEVHMAKDNQPAPESPSQPQSPPSEPAQPPPELPALGPYELTKGARVPPRPAEPSPSPSKTGRADTQHDRRK